MQALLAMASAEPPAAKIAVDPAAVQNAMSDFVGANMVDTIVDHFAGASAPAIAMNAIDHVSQVLAQPVDAGFSSVFQPAMTAMADADAHALAVAQA